MRIRIGVLGLAVAGVLSATALPAGSATPQERPLSLVADRGMAGPPGPFCRNTAWGRSLEAYRVGDGTIRLTVSRGLPGDSILGASATGFPYKNSKAQIQFGQSSATTPNFVALLDLDYLFTAENGARISFQCRD
jgi:hypothetical protein